MGDNRSVLKRRLALGAKLVWAGLAILVLTVSLVRYDGKPNSDIEEFMLYGMLFLSFPSGWIFIGLLGLIYALIGKFLGLNIPTSIPEMILTWTGFFICGYLQWFWLVPRAFRGRRANKPCGSVGTGG